DKDLLQLVSDHVTVYVTKKGVSEVEAYTPDTLKEKLGIDTEQMIDFKELMGDSSDNIPGVLVVGEKTAQKLLKQYESIEEDYENIEDYNGKRLKENLKKHKDDAFMSKDLVTINEQSPVEITLDD